MGKSPDALVGALTFDKINAGASVEDGLEPSKENAGALNYLSAPDRSIMLGIHGIPRNIW